MRPPLLALLLCAAFIAAVSGDSRELQFPMKFPEEDDSNCTTISELVCDNGGLYDTDTLCEAIQMAGLQDDLETDMWTLFAPTDEAFDTLPDSLLDVLMGGPTMDDTRALTDMLAFHTVPSKEIFSFDLICDARTVMVNEEFSVTRCEGGSVFQVGLGNLNTDYPEIVEEDIEACNGVIHLIDKVMLSKNTIKKEQPTSPPSTSYSDVSNDFPPTKDPCSIAEIACDSDEFKFLCAAIQAAGLEEVLGDSSGNYTVFAPDDTAFINLGEVAIAYLMDPDNIDLLVNILAFHTLDNEIVYSEDLVCKETIEMSNGKDSRTVCRKGTVFQKGKGNSDDKRPEIVEADIETCNGIIHVVSEVMLFDYPDELGIPPKDATFAPTTPISPTPSPSPAPSKAPAPCRNVDEILCDDPDFSILCTSLESAGIATALATGTWTIFAPSNQAFLKLPPEYVQKLTDDPELLSNLLLFHAVGGPPLYSMDLPCVAGQNLIKMANGKDTRTLCDDIRPGVPVPKFQKGKYNSDENPPAFVEVDQEACNGVIHELDSVMLFRKIH